MKTLFERLSTLILTGALCLSFAGAVDAKPFSDVNENNWYYFAVAMANDVGYMTGYPDGTFRPNETMTRAECAQILCNITPYWDAEVYYSDVHNSSWYANVVNHYGPYMGGTYTDYSQPTPIGYARYFYPKRACTREDFAYGLSNILNLPDVGGPGFDDYDKINPQYADGIMRLRHNGIVNGDGFGRYGRFNPKNTITRAEVAQIITNYVQWNLSNH